MKSRHIAAMLAMGLVGIVPGRAQSVASPTAATAKVDQYARRYWIEKGNLFDRLGLVGHYREDFERRFLQTSDQELKRSYVLYMLAADLDDDIRNWERGVTMIGPNQYREMTSAERETSLQSILQRLADMSEMDPRDSLKGVGELRKRIGNIYETKTGEKLPNQPPLRMPVGGTPAADAPVAPPPGIAGR